ncbi:ABC transporter substrate-binding protein [Myxosarcina sp. GI1(2024)]
MFNFLSVFSKVIYRRAIAAIALITTILSLTSCNPADFRTNAENVPQLVQAILSDPKTFNPVLATDATSSSVGDMLFDGLVTQNPITAKTEPALAESWEISEDNLRIVFTLRKGLQWSDGKPLTADDVVFSYNQIYLNEEIPSSARDVIRVGESQALPTVRKLNDLQIEFTIPEPFAPFLNTTGGLSILPKHILQPTIENKDPNGKPLFLSTWTIDASPENIVANSAYQLKNYVTNQRLIFEKNPYYWKKNIVNEDIPYIEKVIWEIIESTDTFLLQFRSGGLDSVSVYPEFFSLLKKEEDKGNFTIYNGGPDYGTNFITFNLNQGKKSSKPLVDPIKSRWFNNLNFRKAVAYAINRPRMVNNIYRGLGQLQNSPISVQSPFYYEDLKGYEYNLEKARQLLKKAGFKYNNKQQLLDSEGNRVSFILYTNSGNKIREAMGNQIETDLAQIGIDVKFRIVNFNVLVGKLSDSLDWEAIILGFTGGNEPNSGANLWSVDGNLHFFNQKPTAGQEPIEGRIVADWEAKIDELFIAGAKELDREKRKAIYAEIQQIVSDKAPIIYLVNPLALGAVRNKYQGIEYSALGGAFWNLEEIKIVQ